ncbi:uncharacterized protein EV154DRAFT_606420, partial [Mucor mucedo]|uniref:uncharacterized protein n=1 Tax=Mucor mucedo TaxID=29922 RepID=UPI00221F2228
MLFYFYRFTFFLPSPFYFTDMSFQNYSSADFINGQRPNPPVVRGRPRVNPPSAAQIPTDVPVPS